ncbi:MAG: P1 family peptidase [Thermomicrobiales bacterium]
MSDNWFRIGHITDSDAHTGCTVLVFDYLVPAAVDVRGGAPGTRETTLLGTGQRGLVDAVVLSGGSAFGLSTVDGVMTYLLEQGRGLPTPAGPVPLVPAAIIFDLAVGDPVRPDASWGRAAAESAASGDYRTGRVGAGTGATVAKLGGQPTPAGIGWGFADSSVGRVSAIVVLNAVGDIVNPADGSILRGATDPEGGNRNGADLLRDGVGRARQAENTSIGCVVIDGPLDRYALNRAAIAAHDGLARTVVPAHTPFDGDTFFAVARKAGEPDVQDVASVCVATTQAVENAILDLFLDPSESSGNDPRTDP